MEAAKINKRGSRGGGRAGNRGGGRAGSRGGGRAGNRGRGQAGNRGRGRAENRGRGRAENRGRGVARSFDFTMSTDDVVDVSSAATGPSRPMTSVAEEMLAEKTTPRIRVRQWARLPEPNTKEVGHFLMPDAPPRRKRRNVSPVRVSCPLMPGTPEVPPPRIPQRWELEKSVLDVNGPSRVVLAEDVATPSFANENPLVCIPATEIIIMDEGQEVDETLLVDASVELVGFSPSTSLSAERSTPQNSSPGSLTSSTRPEPSFYEEIIIMDEGQEVDENFLVDASVELVGFSPSTSLSAERSTPQNSSSGSLTSSTRPEPSIYEENVEEEILEWERSAGLNPGSDDEEDWLDDINPRRTLAGEFAEEELSSELREVLETLDRQDDFALRESIQEDMLAFDWSCDPQVFTGVRENFTGAAGPTFPTEGLSPFQIFSKIWDEDIINLIVKETNKYAANLMADLSLPQFSRLKQWTPITPQDLWTFFGIIMLQSFVPIPVEGEYWYPSLPYLKLAKFNELMSLKRFLIIKRCLHFVDNMLCARGIPTKLMKIKPIIDHLNNKFSSLYLPEQEIAIDESLLLWKGRLSFAQAIANKAAQVGIKSYELCESRTGYLWQMIIYGGKNDRHNVEANVNMAEFENTSSKTVLKLVRPLLNRGHTLVMDNFYNSPLLARTLKAQKTDSMGTLRLNRNFVPESLRNKSMSNMRPGEVAFSQTRDLTISVWRDMKVVALISTYHKVEVGGKEKYGYYRYKPRVVLDYNLAMGGVDKKDQLLQAFPVERTRNPIWYKKLFRRLLNVSIHNAFVMFQATGSAKMAQRQFRVRLADEIIQRFRPPKIEKPLPIGHFPAKTNIRKSRCKWCARRKVDTCTVYKCGTCNVNLCIIGCFKDYHITEGLVER